MGVLVFIYVTGWVFIVGGTMVIINEIRAPEPSEIAVATGLASIFFSWAIGGLLALVFLVPGVRLVSDYQRGQLLKRKVDSWLK